jgi:hypothetical protein
MKNFQGLHKCATGAVINTEDFMKSNKSNTGSMLTGVNNAEALIGDRGAKKRARATRKNQNTWNKTHRSKKSEACKSML